MKYVGRPLQPSLTTVTVRELETASPTPELATTRSETTSLTTTVGPRQIACALVGEWFAEAEYCTLSKPS